MKIALVAALSQTKEKEQNFERLKKWAYEARAAGAQLALFGEAYLQGFEALTFDYQHDILQCESLHSQLLARICAFAKEAGIGLGLGYYELHKGAIYASYLLVSGQGQVMANYRRVSPGWKEPGAHADYREGDHFVSINYQGKELAVMVCGDFWEDALLAGLIQMDDRADAFLWPVHCDYIIKDWEDGEREAYCRRTEILQAPVLFINNYSNIEDRARGGLYHWHQGRTVAAKEMGSEDMLVVEV